MTTTGTTVTRPTSPGVVFAACFLLVGVATAQVIGSVGAFYAVPQLSRHYAEAHGDDTYGWLATALLIVLAALSLVVAGIYGLLAALDSRGLGPARTVTWVVAALTMLVCIPVLVSGFSTVVAWYHWLTTAVAAATAAFAATATVLLALPAAHRYYRAARAARRAARPTPPPLAPYPSLRVAPPPGWRPPPMPPQPNAPAWPVQRPAPPGAWRPPGPWLPQVPPAPQVPPPPQTSPPQRRSSPPEVSPPPGIPSPPPVVRPPSPQED